MYVLFDLDQTLIDSSMAEQLRRQKMWSSVYALIPQLLPYPGISDLLKELRTREAKLCIVTSAPESYCRRVILHWQWPIDATVCYHDTQFHKPDPAPIRAGLLKLGADATRTISVGDSVDDIKASKGAGIYTVAALWGASDASRLLAVDPDAICQTVADLRTLLLTRLGRP